MLSKDAQRPSTRSNVLLDGSRASQALRCSENANLTYGHYTAAAYNQMIQAMLRPEAHFPRNGLDISYYMNESSCFLDIGSGFGFPNFMVAATVGCLSYGVEICARRHEAT